MASHTGWMRVVAEDLPHALGGAAIAAAGYFLHLPSLLCGMLPPLAGVAREVYQMVKSGDTSFGLSRARDVAGWLVGGLWVVFF